MSKHHCFLCLEKVKEVTEGGPGQGGDNGEERGSRTTSIHSIQKLCRHLKLDIGKALSNDKDKNVRGGGEGHQEDLTVELCQECVQLVGAFSEAYQELVDVKRKVASILGGIHGKLLRADESRRMVGEANGDNGGGGEVGGEAGGPVSKVEALRMKMMNECVRKLRGVRVPVPSPTQSQVPEELYSEPGKSKNMKESAEVDSRTASICEDDLVNYQLVGVYDVKLEPMEPEESPGPDAFPEDDVDGACGANGFVAMETGINDNLREPAPGNSAEAKLNGEAATMKNLEETNCDPRPRDHSQQTNSSEMNALPDFPFGQVLEMVNVKLEPDERIQVPEGEDDEAYRNNDLGKETKDMSQSHHNHDLSHSPSPMDMDNRMEVTRSSGYGSSPADFGPFTPPPAISVAGGTHPHLEGQLTYDDGDDDGPKMVPTDMLEVSWDFTPGPLENGGLGLDEHGLETHHHTKTWIHPTTQVRLAKDVDISCAICHLKLTLPLHGPNSHKCFANSNTTSSVSGPLEGSISSEGEGVKPPSLAPVPQKSSASPEPRRPPVAVPPPERVFSGDGNHTTTYPLHRNPATRMHECCCCTKGFGHYGGLYYHHRSVHLGERFNCPWPGCQGSFTRGYCYRVHYRSVHLGIRQAKPKRKKRKPKRTTTLKL